MEKKKSRYCINIKGLGNLNLFELKSIEEIHQYIFQARIEGFDFIIIRDEYKKKHLVRIQDVLSVSEL